MTRVTPPQRRTARPRTKGESARAELPRESTSVLPKEGQDVQEKESAQEQKVTEERQEEAFIEDKQLFFEPFKKRDKALGES